MFSFTEPAAVQDGKTRGLSTDVYLSAQVLCNLKVAQQATFKLHNILGWGVQKPQEIWVNFGLTA